MKFIHVSSNLLFYPFITYPLTCLGLNIQQLIPVLLVKLPGNVFTSHSYTNIKVHLIHFGYRYISGKIDRGGKPLWTGSLNPWNTSWESILNLYIINKCWCEIISHCKSVPCWHMQLGKGKVQSSIAIV